MTKTKFKIGQAVQMEDLFSFNPASKTISIGKIEAIHIHGVYVLYKFLTPAHPITYSISGFSLRPGESELTAYEGEK